MTIKHLQQATNGLTHNEQARLAFVLCEFWLVAGNCHIPQSDTGEPFANKI